MQPAVWGKLAPSVLARLVMSGVLGCDVATIPHHRHHISLPTCPTTNHHGVVTAREGAATKGAIAHKVHEVHEVHDATAGATTDIAPDRPLGMVRETPKAAAEVAPWAETIDRAAHHLAAPAAADQRRAVLDAQTLLLAASVPPTLPPAPVPLPRSSPRMTRPTSK
jgi:hypothetical protein